MSFQPILPSTGIVGWNFLQATYEKQLDTFSKGAVLQRESDYFLENIGEVTSAEELVKDHRLLSVALGAFGLSDQIGMKALVQKVLEDGTSADDALAHRLGDDRWVSFSETFGFGPGETVKTGSATDMLNVIHTHKVQSFEEAVGQQDHYLRLAMYAEREIGVLAEEGSAVDTKWYNVLGQPALQEMFQITLGLPKSMGQIDIDQQVEIMKERSQSIFGSDDISVFTDPEKMEKLINTFLARSEIAAMESSQSGFSNALTLLMG
ncbi:DUF1217 domain-containing protein [Cribrihabitans neustonicus]|uniref:DUF1217 domain-containing protein n=1 Tax=Cribrihabitans neustonicus TaxID=1429085 RepID=UPI003B5BE00A